MHIYIYMYTYVYTYVQKSGQTGRKAPSSSNTMHATAHHAMMQIDIIPDIIQMTSTEEAGRALCLWGGYDE